MSLNRYAKRRDDNEAEIVAALESIGVTVYRLDKPVDLLCFYRGVTFLVEVKNPKGKNRTTKDQDIFLDFWPGRVHIIRSVEEALEIA